MTDEHQCSEACGDEHRNPSSTSRPTDRLGVEIRGVLSVQFIALLVICCCVKGKDVLGQFILIFTGQICGICAIILWPPHWWPKTIKWNSVRRWLFLNVWLRHGYRPAMRVLHLFNLHYMPPMTRMIGQPENERHCWCRWCGFRLTTTDQDRRRFRWNRVDRTR